MHSKLFPLTGVFYENNFTEIRLFPVFSSTLPQLVASPVFLQRSVVNSEPGPASLVNNLHLAAARPAEPLK